MSKIAIITARGGSKRIPRKNIKHFYGKPILEYSINCAIESNLFDKVMVSTDDKEIAEIAMKAGASVPFLRSAKNADDYATLADVLLEVISDYEKNNEYFDFVCCLLPTAPFLKDKHLKTSFEMLKTEEFTSVFPVRRFSYPIQRSLFINSETKYAQMFWPENYPTRSQDLEPAYHDCGQFYFMRTAALKREKILFTEKSGTIELGDMEVQDIDTLEDWELAEFKYHYNLTKA